MCVSVWRVGVERLTICFALVFLKCPFVVSDL
jgi:hypothetical protein